MRKNKTMKHLKYTFTDEEIKDLSYELAKDTRELRSLNESKKEVMADFTGKIRAKEGSTDRVSEHIANGYEYRMVQCEVVFDSPLDDEKTITRIDTGETWTEPMEDHEKQQELFEE